MDFPVRHPTICVWCVSPPSTAAEDFSVAPVHWEWGYCPPSLPFCSKFRLKSGNYFGLKTCNVLVRKYLAFWSSPLFRIRVNREAEIKQKKVERILRHIAHFFYSQYLSLASFFFVLSSMFDTTTEMNEGCSAV